MPTSPGVTAAADRQAVSNLINVFRVEAEQALAGINQRLKESGGPETLAKVIGAFYLLLEEAGQRVVRLHAAVVRARVTFPNDTTLVAIEKRVAAQLTVWAALAEGFSWYVRPATDAEKAGSVRVGAVPVAVIVVAVGGVAVLALSATGVAWAVVHWQMARNLATEIDAIEKDPALAEAFRKLNESAGGTGGPSGGPSGGGGLLAGLLLAAAGVAAGVAWLSRGGGR